MCNACSFFFLLVLNFSWKHSTLSANKSLAPNSVWCASEKKLLEILLESTSKVFSLGKSQRSFKPVWNLLGAEIGEWNSEICGQISAFCLLWLFGQESYFAWLFLFIFNYEWLRVLGMPWHTPCCHQEEALNSWCLPQNFSSPPLPTVLMEGFLGNSGGLLVGCWKQWGAALGCILSGKSLNIMDTTCVSGNVFSFYKYIFWPSVL